MTAQKQILLTGVRASGDIHLGNYLGAMKPALARQEQFQTYMFIADLHGLTTTPPAAELRHNVQSIASAWLASGLDPKKTVVWKQSDVPEVLELAYILSCVTSFGLLERSHSVKDARAKGGNLKSGLVFYPVLMAADILLYDSDVVPVGKDQAQHLEMTRDMATFFNENYGEIFKLPQAMILENVAIVPGIDGRKMSKSYDNGIDIFAPEAAVKKQVMSIVTDSKSLQEPKNPEECIVYQIYRLIAPEAAAKDMHQKLARGGYGYGDAKKATLELILDHFATMRKNYDHWMKHPDELGKVLKAGADRAQSAAQQMMKRIKDKVGL